MPNSQKQKTSLYALRLREDGRGSEGWVENALQSQCLVLRPGEHSLRAGLKGWFSTVTARGTLKALEEHMPTPSPTRPNSIRISRVGLGRWLWFFVVCVQLPRWLSAARRWIADGAKSRFLTAATILWILSKDQEETQRVQEAPSVD